MNSTINEYSFHCLLSEADFDILVDHHFDFDNSISEFLEERALCFYNSDRLQSEVIK